MKKLIFLSLLTNLLFGSEFCIIVNSEASITRGYTNSIDVPLVNKFGYGFMIGNRRDYMVRIDKWDGANKSIGATIGWIDSRDILCSADNSTPFIESKRVKYLDGNKTKDSMLYEKALVVNRLRIADSSTKVIDIPIYKSYNTNSTNQQSSKLYGIFFIFAEDDNRILLSKVSYISSEGYTNNSNHNIVNFF